MHENASHASFLSNFGLLKSFESCKTKMCGHLYIVTCRPIYLTQAYKENVPKFPDYIFYCLCFLVPPKSLKWTQESLNWRISVIPHSVRVETGEAQRLWTNTNDLYMFMTTCSHFSTNTLTVPQLGICLPVKQRPSSAQHRGVVSMWEPPPPHTHTTKDTIRQRINNNARVRENLHEQKTKAANFLLAITRD